MAIAMILTSEHHLIRDYVDHIQVAAEINSQGETIPKEFFQLALDFSDTFVEKFHHIKEEEVLFPVLTGKVDGQIDQQFKELKQQHKRAEMFVMEIRRCLDGFEKGDRYQSKLFWRNLGAYISFLRVHMNRENHLFFPMIDTVLSTAEEQEILRRFEVEEDKLGKDYLQNCKKTLWRMTTLLNELYGERYKYLLDSVSSKRTNFKVA